MKRWLDSIPLDFASDVDSFVEAVKHLRVTDLAVSHKGKACSIGNGTPDYEAFAAELRGW